MTTFPEPKPGGLSDAEFAHFSTVIERDLGIHMPPAKRAMVEARLARRMRELRLPDHQTYYRYFFSAAGAEERATVLANVITTNKSDFFREPKHFQFLQRHLEKAGENYQRRPFRVWSAGCATGEEPYTLAMLLNSHAESHPGFRYTVFGTDVSERALDEAVRGVFPEIKLAPVPLHFRQRYFLRSRESGNRVVRIIPELREKVQFARLNFMLESYPVGEPFDCIFFRNVMIYFPENTQSRVVNRLCGHLTPGGYFFPGHTESLNNCAAPLQAIAPAIYQKHAHHGGK